MVRNATNRLERGWCTGGENGGRWQQFRAVVADGWIVATIVSFHVILEFFDDLKKQKLRIFETKLDDTSFTKNSASWIPPNWTWKFVWDGNSRPPFISHIGSNIFLALFILRLIKKSEDQTELVQLEREFLKIIREQISSSSKFHRVSFYIIIIKEKGKESSTSIGSIFNRSMFY